MWIRQCYKDLPYAATDMYVCMYAVLAVHIQQVLDLFMEILSDFWRQRLRSTILSTSLGKRFCACRFILSENILF